MLLDIISDLAFDLSPWHSVSSSGLVVNGYIKMQISFLMDNLKCIFSCSIHKLLSCVISLAMAVKCAILVDITIIVDSFSTIKLAMFTKNKTPIDQRRAILTLPGMGCHTNA